MPAWDALVLWLLMQFISAAMQLGGSSNVAATAHLGGAEAGFQPHERTDGPVQCLAGVIRGRRRVLRMNVVRREAYEVGVAPRSEGHALTSVPLADFITPRSFSKCKGFGK
jgi:hypothetical protein